MLLVRQSNVVTFFDSLIYVYICERRCMNKMISIIVPVYNAEKYLDRCINSIIEQTYQNLELILVDDGSTDRSNKICNTWISKDDRIKYYYQKNGGVSSARNLGLMYANGKYIAFVDADDYLHHAFAESMIEKLSNSNADIIFCERKNLYSSGKIEITGTNSHKLEIINSVDYEYYGRYERRSVWGAVYDRRILKELSFSEMLAVGEDALYLIQAIQRSKRVAYYDDALYNYTIQNESAYFGEFTQKKGTEIQAWLQICDAIKEEGITKKSAVAMCAIVAKTMLSKYAGSLDFDRCYIDFLIGIYRKKLPQLLQYDRLKNFGIMKEIKHVMFGMFPHLVVEYWKLKNYRTHSSCNL